MSDIASAISEHFAGLEDPRAEHLNDHKLLDIIMIAVCTVICGAEGWTDVELFGNERLAWLRQFLELEHGIPSHDTFGRVFARLGPVKFEQCFIPHLLEDITLFFDLVQRNGFAKVDHTYQRTVNAGHGPVKTRAC